jgi:hypothetical protein
MTLAGGAIAVACPPPPSDQLTFRQMIRRHTTGDPDFPVMILGKVVGVKDLFGGPKGKAIAKLAVAEHPVGSAPLVARVRFYRPKADEPDPTGNYERFRMGRHYVVIASRRSDGSFDIQQLCGPCSEVGRHRFRSLVRLARRS